MSPLNVKVCGITRAEDALLACALGAGFLGLNFWPGSSRFLEVPAARLIAAAVRRHHPGVKLVGVFVDEEPAAVERTAAAVGLDLVQFHGDEPAEQVEAFAERAVRVFRTRGGFDPSRLDAYPRAWGFLFDVATTGGHGGTGLSWDYSSLRGLAAARPGRPFFVAGGVGPANARDALEASGAFGIDLCSGVESSPGVKDPDLLRRLFAGLTSMESLHGQSAAST